MSGKKIIRGLNEAVDYVRDLSAILAAADSGTPVADIAREAGLTPRRIYAILQEYRPRRKRKPRAATSSVPAKVQALRQTGASVSRIAYLLGVSRAYVYRILKG